MLPKMSGYPRNYDDETKRMSFLIEHDEFMKNIKSGINSAIITNFTVIWNTMKTSMRTKIKSYEGKVNTVFHDDEISKQGCYFICLSVILIDSAVKRGKNYYSQVLVEECKYVVK